MRHNRRPQQWAIHGCSDQAAIKASEIQTERLTRELDITNADHIALWLEANMGDSSLAWLACRIVEAHEAAQPKEPQS